MELNHQIRLCRPFPFLFGFRAIGFTSPNVAEQYNERHTILQKCYYS